MTSRSSSPGSTCPGSPATGRSWCSTPPIAVSGSCFPSPFLRNAPTELVIEGGTVGSPRSWATHEVVAYEEAFKLELIEFADSIAEQRAPRTTGEDGLADVELCVEIIEAMQAGGPVRRLSTQGEG